MEFLLGYKRPGMIKHFKAGDPATELIQRRLGERSLIDHFYDFLQQQGVVIPKALMERDVSQPNVGDEAVQDGLFRLYKTRPDLVILFETMTDFDEGLQEWRYRHVKLVERTIGAKQGTGGSMGVEFLKKSLFQPVFADLWAFRHKL